MRAVDLTLPRYGTDLIATPKRVTTHSRNSCAQERNAPADWHYYENLTKIRAELDHTP
jgi:hypothetical protein